MEPNQSEHIYSVLFDERQESWYVSPGSERRIALSRVSLQHLISLYNDIHRGAPLTLIDQRAMEELGAERRELHDTVRSLYDYIDAEAQHEESLPAPLAILLRWRDAAADFGRRVLDGLRAFCTRR